MKNKGNRSGSSFMSSAQSGLLGAFWSMIAVRVLNRLNCGYLLVVMPDGTRKTFGDPESQMRAELWIQNWRVVRRYINHGAVGFAEAFIEGDIDTPDLAALLTLLDGNCDAINGYYGSLLSKWQRALKHGSNSNSYEGSKRNIHAHYDLGNAFFQEWLDPSMTYSAAMFAHDEQDLEEAQKLKYEHLCRQLEIMPEQHLLEIGCGWGGFAEHTAKTYGIKVDSITISKAQHDYASKRIFEAGLNEKVSIKLQDYRDVRGQYDRIASIEMFEAVGEAYWPEYFSKLRANLAHSGRASLQVITIADRHFNDYRKSSDFIQQYIFPGGMLPSPSILRRTAEDAGLIPSSWVEFGKDYAKTLAIWSERFHKTFDSVRDHGFDDRFKRIWHYYLAYCEAGFRTGSTNVVQVALKPA